MLAFEILIVVRVEIAFVLGATLYKVKPAELDSSLGFELFNFAIDDRADDPIDQLYHSSTSLAHLRLLDLVDETLGKEIEDVRCRARLSTLAGFISPKIGGGFVSLLHNLNEFLSFN